MVGKVINPEALSLLSARFRARDGISRRAPRGSARFLNCGSVLGPFRVRFGLYCSLVVATSNFVCPYLFSGLFRPNLGPFRAIQVPDERQSVARSSADCRIWGCDTSRPQRHRAADEAREARASRSRCGPRAGHLTNPPRLFCNSPKGLHFNQQS